MKLYSEIPNAGWIILLFIILAAGITYLVYFYKNKRDQFTKLQLYTLSSIKFVYTVALLLLLISLLLEKTIQRIEKPILLLGIDNSESVVADSTNATFINNLTNEIGQKLGSDYQVEFLLFGKEVVSNNKPTFSDKVSNYSDFFTEIEKRYYNLNVGPIVLIGDGIYNEGQNPEQMVANIKSPVFTVALGDTMSKSDQAVIDVTHNPSVFIGNTFPLEIETSFTDYKQESTQLTVTIDGKIKYSEQIEIPQPNYYLKRTLNLKAEDAGLKTVVVNLSPFMNEANIVNNSSRFTIEVHNNKHKVLILSQGPHPDIGAITETLIKQANFQVNFSEIALFSGKVEDFDLVVLNQLPSMRYPSSDVYKQLSEKKVPCLVIVGPNTSIPAFNNLGIEFTIAPALMKEESSPYFNPAFSYFTLPASITEAEKIYPPLLTYYTEFKLSDNYSILAYQRIKGVNMNLPLIAMGQIENRKVGVIAGEGIWRWRIQEYQSLNSQAMFNQLVAGMFDYLCVKEVKEQFKLEYKRVINEATPIVFKAQVFNDTYQPINTSEINFTLTDSTGNELKYLFSANDISYQLNIGSLLPGNYKFVASTKVGDKDFSKSGEFIVQELNIEQINLKANYQTLNYLSASTKGMFFTKATASNVIDYLSENKKQNTVVVKEKSIDELIDWKIYMFLVVILFSLEWFLRKYWGSY